MVILVDNICKDSSEQESKSQKLIISDQFLNISEECRNKPYCLDHIPNTVYFKPKLLIKFGDPVVYFEAF